MASLTLERRATAEQPPAMAAFWAKTVARISVLPLGQRQMLSSRPSPSSTRAVVEQNPISGRLCISSTCCESFSGSHQSSASRNATYVPRALRMPALRAADMPRLA